MDEWVQCPEIAVIPGGPPPRDTLCDFRDSTYTLYVRSKGKVLAEYAIEGAPPPRRKYIYAGDTRIAMIDYFGDLYFYLNDHLGSARVVVADSSGVAFDKYSYYAFGGNLSTTTSTNQAHRYTGKPLDEENGLNLYYYGARYNDSDVGAFPAVDPLHGKYPGWSPYAYTLNNPIRYIDPDGETPAAVIGSIIGAVVGGGVELTSQLISGGPINTDKLVGATVRGGITGAVAGLTGGASLLVSVSANAGASVVGGMVERSIGGEQILNSDAVVTDLFVGGTGGAAGNVAQNVVNSVASETGANIVTQQVVKNGSKIVAATRVSGKAVGNAIATAITEKKVARQLQIIVQLKHYQRSRRIASK